jgi:hypothetical protein
MLHNRPDLPQEISLAFERHAQLLEEAERRRRLAIIRQQVTPVRRWRKVRFRLGEFLINVGQRLASEPVWK